MIHFWVFFLGGVVVETITEMHFLEYLSLCQDSLSIKTHTHLGTY